ncbi:MAG: hypothetical protein ACREXT_13340 [Gammaproteobacteria bacterium]
MNRYTYRVYYEWNGPSHADPFRSKKNADQIKYALTRFPEEIPHYMSDPEANVESTRPAAGSDSISLVVATTKTEAETDDAVRRCLNGLDLFGSKVGTA